MHKLVVDLSFEQYALWAGSLRSSNRCIGDTLMPVWAVNISSASWSSSALMGYSATGIPLCGAACRMDMRVMLERIRPAGGVFKPP
jgi:hypothetical protein